MIDFPHAKINIGLNITNRRADGYHDLQTIFYPIKIKDVLEVLPSDGLSFEASGLGIPGRTEDNLCLKGYHLLKQDFSELPPVKIHLHKHIPIGAGLGGGSADAAFFIKLINKEFSLGLDSEQMRQYARKLGADCAFFIDGQPTYAFGKGDEFAPVALNLSDYYIVLVMPPARVSTAEAYRGVQPRQAQHALTDSIALPVADWKHIIKNDFEESIFKNHPVIRGVKSSLYEAGALYACMSGSGASVFGIFNSRPDLVTLEKHNQVFYNV